jgi:hypothetical protein
MLFFPYKAYITKGEVYSIPESIYWKGSFIHSLRFFFFFFSAATAACPVPSSCILTSSSLYTTTTRTNVYRRIRRVKISIRFVFSLVRAMSAVQTRTFSRLRSQFSDDEMQIRRKFQISTSTFRTTTNECSVGIAICTNSTNYCRTAQLTLTKSSKEIRLLKVRIEDHTLVVLYNATQKKTCSKGKKN